MASYVDTLKSKQTELIRKSLDGSVFIAPESAELLDSLTSGATGEIQALPALYKDLGWLTTDGAQFSRDVTTSTVTSWGSVTPTRSDVTADVSTLTVSCQETSLVTVGLATGAQLTAVSRDATTGELIIKKPSRASSRVYRVLSVAVDETSAGEIYIARYLPRARVSGFAEQSFGGGDDPITWGVTFTGEEDSDFGASEAWMFGGPGWRSLLVDMGFTAATP